MDYINKSALTVEQLSNLKKFLSDAVKIMSSDLYAHTIATLKYSDKLCRIYLKENDLNYYRIYAASILHDFAKPLSIDQQLDIIKKNETAKSVQGLNHDMGPILHGFAAYHMIKKEYNIEDEIILNSVRFHTVGCVNMNMVDKVLYIADKIEEGRNYDNVGILRGLSIKNLNLCLLEVYKNNIIYIIENNKYLYKDTCFIWNNICKNYGGLNGSR